MDNSVPVNTPINGNIKKLTETMAVIFSINMGRQLEAIQLSDFASAKII